ncbi:hypothetical protein NHX12_000998, partial [Muraenolepis orangiensis]
EHTSAMVRWFHRDITGREAEALLKSQGIHGSFLARPSKKNVGDFTLSVRVKEDVTHIRIQNTGDYYDLYGGEKFATMSELVEYYMADSGTLQDRDGKLIELKVPLNSSQPTTERWYHGHLSGPGAEKLLGRREEVGTFLVRGSLSNPGDFVLSVLTEEKTKKGDQRVTHIKILCQNESYSVGDTIFFDTLADLVEHYKRMGIEEVSGYWVHLKQPFYNTQVNAADIDTRVKILDQTAQSPEESGEKSKAGFSEEFETLQKLEAKVKKSREEGQRPENKSKNRYKNILPFNDTRVRLQNADPAVVGSDYINANYVKNTLRPDDKKVFIASQGCLATTVNDFWQMVWQEKTRIIVMTTRLVEKGRNKCVLYWPDVDGTKEVGPYMVTCISVTEATDYIVRVLELSLSNKSQPRRIWHYQYLSWPDHGVPGEPGGVLSFLAQVNAKQEKFDDAGPMIIHCSAGIGRTGTFVVIDMILHTIETRGVETDIDIQKCIQMVREQRSGMVQTEAQYKFIYLAISDHIQAFQAHSKASRETETEYGNLELKHPPASRKVSKNREELYENLTKGKKDVKKQKSEEKKSGSDNMDAYLATLDINFALRKIVCLLKPTKQVEHDPATGGMKIRTVTTFKNFDMDFSLGQEFTEDLGPVDGRVCQLLLHADCNEQEVMCEISRYHFSYGAQSADDHAHFLIATLDLQGGGLSTTLVLQTHPPPPEPAPTDPDPGSPRTLGVGRLGLPLSQSGSLLTEVVFLVFSKDKELSAPLGGDALLHCGFRQQETGQEVGQEVAVEWRVQHRGRGVRVLDLKVLIDSPEHSQAGKVTREGASVDIALLVAGGNASMTLRELKVSDEGTYICTINIGIVKAQQTIKLHVHKNKLVSQEFPDKLSCHCQNYYPLDAKTEWFSISPGNAEMTDLSGRTSLSSHQRHRDGTLSLSSSLDLEQSSFPPGTTLTCRVTHPALAVPFSISLVVQEPIAGPTDLIYLLVFLPITVLCCVLLYLLMRSGRGGVSNPFPPWTTNWRRVTVTLLTKSGSGISGFHFRPEALIIIEKTSQTLLWNMVLTLFLPVVGEGGVDVVLSCFLVEEASGLDEMGNGDPFSRSHATLVLRDVSVDPEHVSDTLTPFIPPTVPLLLHADCNEQEVLCEISRYHFPYGAQSADDHAHFFIATLDLEGGGFSTTLVLQTHPPPPASAPAPAVGRLGLPLSQSGSLLTEVVFLVFSKDKELSAPLASDVLLHCGFRQQETGQEVGQEVAVEWRLQHRGRKVTREGSRVDVALLVAGGNASMTLRELKVSDEGTYICTINIGIFQAQQTIKLHVNQNKLVSQEFPDKLSCHCQNYYPLDAKMEWFSISPGNAEMTDLSSRTSLSSHRRHRDETLSLSSSLDLEQSSFPPGTTLTCRVTHPALADPVSISLVVQEPTVGTYWMVLGFLLITVLFFYQLMR